MWWAGNCSITESLPELIHSLVYTILLRAGGGSILNLIGIEINLSSGASKVAKLTSTISFNVPCWWPQLLVKRADYPEDCMRIYCPQQRRQQNQGLVHSSGFFVHLTTSVRCYSGGGALRICSFDVSHFSPTPPPLTHSNIFHSIPINLFSISLDKEWNIKTG